MPPPNCTSSLLYVWSLESHSPSDQNRGATAVPALRTVIPTLTVDPISSGPAGALMLSTTRSGFGGGA